MIATFAQLNSDISKVLIRGSNFTAVQSPSNNGCRIQINDSGDITKGDLTDGTVTKWENILTNADLPLSAKTYQLGGSQTLSFSYAGGNASCVIFAMRDSNAGIYLCDNWNNVVTAKDFANLNVSISNKTVTIQNNNANMAISIIVLIANNMPITQA